MSWTQQHYFIFILFYIFIFYLSPCFVSFPVPCLLRSFWLYLLPSLFCPFLCFPGESACKHMFKIPLCNLVGRSIERPLKSPLVNKVLTTPAPAMVPPTPLISATHSLSLSRMEIKEIASRTRKELLGKKPNLPEVNVLMTGVMMLSFRRYQKKIYHILHKDQE